MSSVFLTVFGGVCVSFSSEAAHPDRVSVDFSITQDVGFGNEVFVQGAHRDFSSGGILSRGVKLRWSEGNVWSGKIALEAGAQVDFQFFSVPTGNVDYCAGLATSISEPQLVIVGGADGPPYGGKTMIYKSDWDTVFLFYRDLTTGGPWMDVAMRRTGEGRTPSESVFQVDGIALPGSELEFVFHNDSGDFDNAPAPPSDTAQGAAPSVPVPYQSLSTPYNYRTGLDVFSVQDGQIYQYCPTATVSAPTVSTVFVNSTVSGIPGRNIRIYLPRGYTENTAKRYPVVYFHDGQNVFFPGGAFGTWDADRIASYEISMGRMREAILVAVDNANGYGSDRALEYIPPEDDLVGDGLADDYLQFLLDNVMPTLDFNYRTLNEPGKPAQLANTIVAGSSLGGLATSYIGVNQSDRFGKIGVFSPAFWAGPNFYSRALSNAAQLPLRIYMDIGTSESSSGQSSSNAYWQDALAVYNDWLADGYVVNQDLLFYPECGGLHNEAAWSRRLPRFYQFALSPWDEVNPLELEQFPPRLILEDVDPGAGTATLSFLAPRGVDFNLNRGVDPSVSDDQVSLPEANRLWEIRTLNEVFPAGDLRRFWRLEYDD